MAVILEQDGIDVLIQKQAKLDASIEAVDKIGVIYNDATGYALTSMLDTLTEIGRIITEIDKAIKPSSQYFEDFRRLQRSYIAEVSG